MQIRIPVDFNCERRMDRDRSKGDLREKNKVPVVIRSWDDTQHVSTIKRLPKNAAGGKSLARHSVAVGGDLEKSEAPKKSISDRPKSLPATGEVSEVPNFVNSQPERTISRQKYISSEKKPEISLPERKISKQKYIPSEKKPEISPPKTSPKTEKFEKLEVSDIFKGILFKLLLRI